MQFQKNKIKGIILAGGKNSRFGSEKALVRIKGERIIDRIVTVMSEVFEENIIITNNEDFSRDFGLITYPDLLEEKGPLMGICTALHHSSSDIFVTACDMPLIDTTVIKKIVGSFKGHDAVIPKYRGKLHFLHAVYSFRCLDILQKKIDGGFLSMKDAMEGLKYNVVEEFKFKNKLFSPFFNMNTPDDLLLVKDYLNDL